ncbi:hypothetical protein PS645_04377 [Pseudomonas fluorescens]|uniref:Uncharacterized protein n=1 Tax=Pseudomonas fluorescens TaxID=294 RepID=A0A5E6W0F2_PSEFL|nr:hypothetical protein PS645_04377 [Pseudomonas fluorescens]
MALLQLERISAQYPGSPEPVLADISLSLGPRQLLVAPRSVRQWQDFAVEPDRRFCPAQRRAHQP